MNTETLNERLFESLINGDRAAARSVVQQAERSGLAPAEVVSEVFWPTYEQIDRLFRHDQLTTLAHHMATRLLRVLVDQQAQKFTRSAPVGRTVFAFCGPTDADELGAQMAVDLLESRGYTVSFAGGGIATDEILATVQENKPDVLLMFASSPSDLPAMRQLIDTIREIGACDGLQIVVGAGVFNRAEGLAEEIGADLWASDPVDLVEEMAANPTRRAPANQRTVGKKRQLRAA
ncbi:MAG: cobalamin-dependent protein [Planctomycetes bacterium]|nr:cobalamin-dependent protein [Planctomycetota bacterium]